MGRRDRPGRADLLVAKTLPILEKGHNRIQRESSGRHAAASAGHFPCHDAIKGGQPRMVDKSTELATTEPMLPGVAFFLIGAPRCGTTALAQALRERDDVCFSVPKETHFFAQIPENWKPELLKQEFVSTFFPPDQLQQRAAMGE